MNGGKINEEEAGQWGSGRGREGGEGMGSQSLLHLYIKMLNTACPMGEMVILTLVFNFNESDFCNQGVQRKGILIFDISSWLMVRFMLTD